ILAEFRDRKKELIQSVYELLVQTLKEKNKTIPDNELPIRITAQGGVGTSEEHQFLLDHYQVDSVGWGTPFLLVPEATSVDDSTMDKLMEAKEEDLYLSNISPLGVPFNNLKGNTKDLEKLSFIAKGRPGSSCPKKYLALNKEFTEKPICTASRQYQHLKLEALEKDTLPDDEYQAKFDKVVESSCLCVGLGTSALIANNVEHKKEGEGVLVCPGPNMAYFSKKMSLNEITGHIYGRENVISRNDRPNMFIKEFNLYLDFLKNKIESARASVTKKNTKYLLTFVNNLGDGVNYYNETFGELKDKFESTKATILEDLNKGKRTLGLFKIEIENLIKTLSVTQ
ncbi:MAG: hypothetical protein OEW67_12640, partial [Cyclobacteriaceae bacterium]|nr:hypothetical protein [Cyclobacteriaceae bacterium]